MLKKSTNIKFTNQVCQSIKAVFNYCLVLLFTLAFSVQQFSAFAFTQLAESAKKESSAHLYSQHLYNSTQFAYHLPFAPNPLVWEMEFVEEDDDEQHKKISVDCSKHCIVEKHSPGELIYTTYLKSRYLQLASSFSNRPSIPFFVLYHSWKSYLS